MILEQEEKIRKIFTEAKTFAVVCENDAGEEVFLAKEALCEILKISALAVYQLPERLKSLNDKWSDFLLSSEGFSPLYSTSILIPKNRFGAKEISYSDDGQNISININSAKEEISKDSVIFKNNPPKADAVFYFTPANDQIQTKISLPEEKSKVIVLHLEKEQTISEQVFEIISKAGLNNDLEKTGVPNLLLASLVLETNYFKNNFSEKTANLLGELLRLGADKNKIDKIASNKENSFVRLLGRAMARTSINEPTKSVWSFISLQDLEKTGNENADNDFFRKIALKIKEMSATQPVFVLLWQKKEGVFGIILAEHAEMAEKLKLLLPAKSKNGLLFCGRYNNFTEAEMKIQNALKEVV